MRRRAARCAVVLVSDRLHCMRFVGLSERLEVTLVCAVKWLLSAGNQVYLKAQDHYALQAH